MPARLVVELVPARGRCEPPPHTGPAVYAALLAALRDHGAASVAHTFHAPRGRAEGQPSRPKPFSLTPLLDERDRLASASSQRIRFEIGVLADLVLDEVLNALAGTTTMRVARCEYQVARVAALSVASYPDLLARARPQTSWGLRLVTPTGFATAAVEGPRRMRPLPEPERVFTSLHTRWRALSGSAALPDGLFQAIPERLELVDFVLTQAEHLVKACQPPRRGSVGQVVYRVVGPSGLAEPILSGFDALMSFAGFAGIGDRTAVGMGHVVPVAVSAVGAG